MPFPAPCISADFDMFLVHALQYLITEAVEKLPRLVEFLNVSQLWSALHLHHKS